MAIANRRPGQAFLALVLLIGGAVILIGVTLAFLASSFIDSGYGYQATVQAEAVATAGAHDALLKLVRNTSFSSPGGYNVPVGSSTATVTVTQSAGTATILSVATVSLRTRKINVVAAVNSTTSQITVTSWQAIQ